MNDSANVTQLNAGSVATEEERLGQRVRRMRMGRSWSLSELADKSDISTSTLSKVENERLSLNYDRLMQIAHAFDLSLSEFLADGERSPGRSPGTPATGRMCIDRKGSGREISTDNYVTDYLCTRIRRKSMTPITVAVKADKLSEFGPLLHHEGEEFIYVLSGTIVLHTEFYGPETMEQGDSAYFDATMGHGYTRLGGDDAVILCLMTGEEELPGS